MAQDRDRDPAPRDVVVEALARLDLDWAAFPDVVRDRRLTPEEQMAALLHLLDLWRSDRGPAGGTAAAVVAPRDHGWARRADDLWGSLTRMRFAWTAPAAARAVEAVTEGPTTDPRRFRLALRGAGEVCAAGEADTRLLDALAACRDRLDQERDGLHQVPEMRALARRVIASATPPDLLDLSLLADGDDWAGPARELARAEPAAEVAPLVRLLGDLGPGRPSQTWLREVGDALGPRAARRLLRGWLERAGEADVVPARPDATTGDCLGVLLVAGNDDVVRAAAWATITLTEETWPSEPLGVLARRGAAHNGAPGFPEALALKVASAAVDALVLRGGADDLRVLGDLLEDLQRRDLVRRVGAALARDDDAAAREQQLRRTKAEAVRRQASPAPRKARAAMDSLLRRRFGPDLRAAGFSGGPRTWRRVLDDRVDVVALRAGASPDTGANRVRVVIGTHLDAVHPPDEPHPVERSTVRDHHLDVRLLDDGPRPGQEHDFDEAYLDEVSARLHEVLLPWLDGLREPEALRGLLEQDAGLPEGTWLESRVGSVARRQVLALLALAAGDTGAAAGHLEQLVATMASWSRSGDPEDPALALWSARLERLREGG